MITNEVTALKNNLSSKGVKGLALDIDETLSWTVGWWAKNLSELFGNPENLTPKEFVKKYKYTQNAPFWQTPEALKWMEDKIEDNEFQLELPLVENSNHFVNKLNQIVPVVAYITSRPMSVKNGTKRWLSKHQFPEVPIITRKKESTPMEGNKLKAETLSYLFPEVLGIVDDNPGLVDELPKDYKGYVFLYDNLQHKRKDLNVFPCRSWKEVLKQVAKTFGKSNF